MPDLPSQIPPILSLSQLDLFMNSPQVEWKSFGDPFTKTQIHSLAKTSLLIYRSIFFAFPSFSGIKQRRVQNPQESHRRQTMNSQIAIALKYVRKNTHVRNSGTNGRRSNPCLVSKNSLWVPLIHHHHHHSSHGFPVPSNLKHFAMGPLKIFVGTSL